MYHHPFKKISRKAAIHYPFLSRGLRNQLGNRLFLTA